ncbi:hypothetical protein [Comamonas sp.]|jgi:hypothetical protein|uniref:hypothetical protein n=1 Tax=Comamonas sp. TaxID=34028 RepID=UPI00289940C4|nr:hypothetical protein [Comamonas sp.]
MTWHVYEIAPIDFGWHNIPKVEDVAGAIASREAQALVYHGNGSVDGINISHFLSHWESAKDAALSKGWEGDHRNDPVVIWLPIEDGFQPAFVLKQDNNGTTFVVSPVPLPHLAQS